MVEASATCCVPLQGGYGLGFQILGRPLPPDAPVHGGGLFFVSRRHDVNGDIYFTQQRPNGSYEPAVRLGPNVNSPLEEWSPSFFYDEQERPVLYFSRNTPLTNTHDIYYSVDYGPAQLAPGLNGPGARELFKRTVPWLTLPPT